MKHILSAKAHYENHLAAFYPWMVGNFEEKVEAFKRFLEEKKISVAGKKVLDLGAGHGIHSICYL